MKSASAVLVCVGLSASIVACGQVTQTTGTGGGSSSSSTKAQTTAAGSTNSTGSSSTGQSTSSTTGTTVSTGTGGTPDDSECHTNADCPGGTCVDVNHGFKMCATPIAEATGCGDPQVDACCTSADCKQPGEKCFAAPIKPVCSGVPMQPHNVCAADECATDNDCMGGVCVPAGTVGNAVRVCVTAQCFGTFCGQESLSPCALVRDPCCNIAVGFYCIDECRNNQDCPNGYCEVNQSTQSPDCHMGAPACPA